MTVLCYVDALFLCCSAMTTAGLSTANLGAITSFHQAVLCILLIVGNVVFVSLFVVIILRHYFRRRLACFVQHSKSGLKILKDVERQESGQANRSKNQPWKKTRSDGQSSGHQADKT
jgi:Cation transport protein